MPLSSVKTISSSGIEPVEEIQNEDCLDNISFSTRTGAVFAALHARSSVTSAIFRTEK